MVALEQFLEGRTRVSRHVEITPKGRYSYTVRVGGHEFHMAEDVGADLSAPSPVEFFAASLGTCNALVAEAFLRKHGLSDEGVRVTVDYDVEKSPRRIAEFRLRIILPVDLTPDMEERLRLSLDHCTVHRTLTIQPRVELTISAE